MRKMWSKQRVARGVMAAKGLAAVAFVGACSVLLPLAGYPPEAGRTTPPPGIEKRALNEGIAAPPIALPSTMGKFTLQPGERQVVLFYRGHW